MMPCSKIEIVDITKEESYENYLYRCLTGPLSKRYKKRIRYLEKAIPRGFHKKLLLVCGRVVGQIEYAPAEVSYYPITGENVIVMNCIWVLRKMKGRNFGDFLVKDMIKSEETASCFASIGLENHWSPWFIRWQMEKIGFKSLDYLKVKHKTKHKERIFCIHFMWMPISPRSEPPRWNKQKLLEGLTACTAHPLYHPQTIQEKQILEEY